MPDDRKTRVQFDFNDDMLKRVDSLVETTDAASRAEVVRRAISLYETLCRADRSGDKIIIEKENGDRSVVMLLI